jgi:hypothetical protein
MDSKEVVCAGPGGDKSSGERQVAPHAAVANGSTDFGEYRPLVFTAFMAGLLASFSHPPVATGIPKVFCR